MTLETQRDARCALLARTLVLARRRPSWISLPARSRAALVLEVALDLEHLVLSLKFSSLVSSHALIVRICRDWFSKR